MQGRVSLKTQPAQPAQRTSTTGPNICRFCQEPERCGTEGELIVPCDCKGGLRHVHRACLRKHQYSAARTTAGIIGALVCNVCRQRFFVGYPSPSEEAQAKCDAVLRQLRPGSLLVAHPAKQTSSRGAFARAVILLVAERHKGARANGASACRLLDNQGGDRMLIGYALEGGRWNPPALASPEPVLAMTLPGGPVKDERALLHTITSLSGATAVPLLGENASTPKLMISPASAAKTVMSHAQQLATKKRPVLLLAVDGAAMWTNEQLVRECVAGSGVWCQPGQGTSGA